MLPRWETLSYERISTLAGSTPDYQIFRVRLLLAQEKATEALELLAPLLINAQTTERWDNVIEMLRLQAQAYQMSHEMQKALAVLTQAVSNAQPEGYIRRFVDEGPVWLLYSPNCEDKNASKDQLPTSIVCLKLSFLKGKWANLPKLARTCHYTAC